MDSPDIARSALDAIDTVAFKVGLKGYNVDEVDEFLERVSVEARQLKDQLQQQRLQLRQAAERITQLEGGRVAAPPPAAPPPAPAPAAPPTTMTAPVRPAGAGAGAEQVAAMIAMAQQFIDHAQQEAQEKARDLTVAAQERAREIVTEARSRAEDEVNRLNGLKQRLSEDVETLGRQLEVERTRLLGVLGEFTRWIDSSLHVGGAARAVPPVHAAPPAAALGPSAEDHASSSSDDGGRILPFDVTRDDRS
ncbi:MAG: DivIVA domain-containing protein [Acidimicrobiales bacterium]